MTFNNYSKKLTIKTLQRSEDSISSENIIQLYKSLNTLCNLFNTIFSFYLVPYLKTICVLGACVGVFGAIKLYGHIESVYYILLPTLAMSCTTHVIVMCTGMASVYENTIDFKLNCKNLILDRRGKRNYKELSCQIKSCRPLRTHIGYMYAFKKSTTLTSLGIVINITAYLLLT